MSKWHCGEHMSRGQLEENAPVQVFMELKLSGTSKLDVFLVILLVKTQRDKLYHNL